MTDGKLSRKYPREAALDKGSVTFRLMGPDDTEAILEFARKLPHDDLLFLRLDITSPEGVQDWMENIKAGRTITVLGEADGAIGGYASVHHDEALWNRHVGEIRVIVLPEYRRRRLGRRLTDEVFAIARDIGLRKMSAQMTSDQRGARATFERLGFQPEALLADFVVDREGKTRDLLIMTHDLAGFTDVEHVAARKRAKAS